MGCSAASSSSHCEYPASGYNPNGVQEALDFHMFHVQAIPDRSCKWRAPNEAQIDPILYTFPMLHTRLSALTLAFSAESIDPNLPKPNLYLEILNIHHDIKKYSIAQLSCGENNTSRKYGFSWKQHEMVEDAQPGDILRIRCHLSSGQRCKIRNLIAELQGSEDGIPIVRLPFEEILDVKENRQTLEMRSYRSWYFRERPTTSIMLGWVNTPVIKSKPESIEVNFDISVFFPNNTPRSGSTYNASNKCGYYSFNLSLIRQGRVLASCPIVQGSHDREGFLQSIRFHVDERSDNNRVRRLISAFSSGDQYQIDRKVEGENMAVKVTKFSLLITSKAMTPICGRLYHQVLLSYLKPIVNSPSSDQIHSNDARSGVERGDGLGVGGARWRNYESKEEDNGHEEKKEEENENDKSLGREFPLINYYYDPHDHGEDGEVMSTSCYGIIDNSEWNFGSSSGLDRARSSDEISK